MAIHETNAEPKDNGNRNEAFHEISRKHRFASFARLWYDRWLSEIFHLILGALCLTAIAALLASYQDAALPLNLPLGLTLSALVSILAAITKYALAVPLDECLGVQKWLVSTAIIRQ